VCVVACDRGTRFATPGQRLIVEGHSPSSHLSDVTYRSPCSGWYICVCVDILPPPPKPNAMGDDDKSSSKPRHTDPYETPTSHSVGISKSNIIKDKSIDEHDIIMNTIADSGADIDVISGKEK